MMEKTCANCLYYEECPDCDIGLVSDGYHTFNELYHHRAVLFSVICNLMPDKAWKSKLHNTGDMFKGMFIVGIETPNGQATYHYGIEPYWDMFKVKELEKAPMWDGHTPTDAINRIGNLSKDKSRYIELPCDKGDVLQYDGVDYEVNHWNIIATSFSKDNKLHLFDVKEAKKALKGGAK